MKVLVNGLGNIGTTVCQLLAEYKDLLNITSIVAHKRTQAPWNESDLNLLKGLDVEIVDSNSFNNVCQTVDYVFETTANTVGTANKPYYQSLNHLKGISAQGSEKDFGIPFISNVNNESIRNQKFVNVVSCNTHGSAAILQLFGGSRLENIETADVVVVRRSEDIGNHQRLVSGNVVARHLDPSIGTHHAIDVIDLYQTLNIACPLTSSDITTPSQFLHAVRFNLDLKEKVKWRQKLNELPYLSRTNKFDSNVIFEIGRRYGFAGRLFAHAILVESNIMENSNRVQGWAFVPQEGNTILSTLHAFLLQTNHPYAKEIMNTLQTELILKEV